MVEYFHLVLEQSIYDFSLLKESATENLLISQGNRSIMIYNRYPTNHVLYIPSLHKLDSFYGKNTGRKLHLRSVQSVRIDKPFDPFAQITRYLYWSP